MVLKGAVAILVGAGRKNGIGAATAKLLAREGCHLLINCLKNKAQAEVVAQECKNEGVEADVFIGDVTQKDVCQNMSKYVQTKWGRADIIVNCLGFTKIADYEKLDQLTADDFSRIFAVNVIGPYLIAQAFQHLLKASGDAVIINVSSVAGMTGKGSSIAYAVSKGAENTLTLALARALSPEVRVNAVCPGFVDSSWWEENLMKKESEYNAVVKNMKEASLLKKISTPVDVANTILAVIQNPIMTGELIRIDAGLHIKK